MLGIPSTRRLITVLIFVAQFGIFSGLRAAVTGVSAPEPEPRVLLIGVDGASWKVIGPMLESLRSLGYID